MKIVGALGGVLYLFVVTPMWFVLLYTLLKAAQVEPWVWGIFWAYVPLSVVAGCLIQAGKGMDVIASMAGGALGGFLMLCVVAAFGLSNEKASQPKCVEGYVFVRDHQLIDDQGHGVRCEAEGKS